VTNNAINTITTIYNKKKEMRKAQYIDYLHSLPYWPIYEQYRGRPPLHPHLVAQLQRQIADADADLKRGIDADWKSCVVRYPEVLNHFYGQVSVTMPRQVEPPFAIAQSHQQPGTRAPSVNPQAQAAHQHRHEQQAAQIMRSSTAPPKKQRRSSKIEGHGGGAAINEDILAQISNQFASLARHPSHASHAKAGRGSPQPPGSTAPRSRPSGKRRESREYVVTGGRNSVAPPEVPQPPSFHHGGSIYGRH
jgi:hypothetical protein